MPYVEPENAEAVEVFMMVRHQHIMGPAGPVTLNLAALQLAFDLVGVKDKKGCYDRVVRMYANHLDKIQTELEKGRG